MKDDIFFIDESQNRYPCFKIDSKTGKLLLKKNSLKMGSRYSYYDDESLPDIDLLNEPICVSYRRDNNRLYDPVYGEEFSLDDDWKKKWIESDWTPDFNTDMDDVNKTIQEIENDLEQIKEECQKISGVPKTLLDENKKKYNAIEIVSKDSSKKKARRKKKKITPNIIRQKIKCFAEKLLDIFIYE